MMGNVSPLLKSRSDNRSSRPFEVSEAIELTQISSPDEIQLVIRAAYRQVFGNMHIMESERLLVAESQLQNRAITVREFIRQLAKSDLYRSNFFENCSRYRSIELNFKHLLGRAPSSYEESSEHSHILDSQGFEAEIDSYLDSDEYQAKFGSSIVPYHNGYDSQANQNLIGFINNLKLYRASSTSDLAGQEGNKSRVQNNLFYNTPSGTLAVTNFDHLIVRSWDKSQFPPKRTTPKYDVEAAIAKMQQEEAARLAQAQAEAREKQQVQSKEAEALRQQLTDLQPLSTLGSQILSPWHANQTQATPSNQSQEDEIQALEEQLMAARSLAAIAESRLNKWRTKIFS